MELLTMKVFFSNAWEVHIYHGILRVHLYSCTFVHLDIMTNDYNFCLLSWEMLSILTNQCCCIECFTTYLRL